MKRILVMLLAITVFAMMIETASAFFPTSMIDFLKAVAEGKCEIFSGKVESITTRIESPTSKDVTIDDGKVCLYPKLPYTQTSFLVRNDRGEVLIEAIYNGNGEDMSAMIAIVQEAFACGQDLTVVRCYEDVEPLYDKLDALDKELAQLPSLYFQKRMELIKWFYSLPEVVKVVEMYRSGEIGPTDYYKMLAELREKTGYNAKSRELQAWYAETKQSLTDQIASLEEKIDYILNNPKLVSVSVGSKYQPLDKPEPEVTE